MKSWYLLHEPPSGRILLVVLAILFIFCIQPAFSASEPGTVTIVLAGEPVNLDAGDSNHSLHAQVLRNNVLETLTEINPVDSSITPRLATSWKQIDEKTWHFTLRKGVKFHDGEDFNANAVVFTIKRLYDKKLVSSLRNKFFTQLIIEGKALDSHTLELRTDNAEPLLPTLMGVLVICSPKTPVDKLVRDPIGTGPYKFVKWDVGTQMILERFDGYWGKQPQVKKAIYVWRSESSLRAAMVLIGEADFVSNIAAQDANRPDMDISYLNSETSFIRIGGEWEPPLNDRRVRMALNLAVDRNALRGTILSKDVVPATQIIVPSIFGYNPDLKVWPYDPKRARQLLDEARKDGVPVDKEILMVGRFDSFPGCQELMEAVMTMYKAVGLNVKLRMVELGIYVTYSSTKPFKGLNMVLFQHNNSWGDAGFTCFYNYHCKGRVSSMCDRQVDELIEKAQNAAADERRNLWRATFKRAHEEIIPMVPLFHMMAYARVGKRINFKPSLATNSEIQVAEITFK